MKYVQRDGAVFAYDAGQADLYVAAIEAGGTDVTGSWPPAKASPTDDEVIAALTADVQAWLDTEARTREYDGILSLCTYASDPDPGFAAEGQAGVVWRGSVWRACYTIMADVKAGNRTVPTAEDLIAALPPMVWPT